MFDQVFAFLVYAAVPPTFLYPLIYGTTTRWWETWIGRALFIKAVGVFFLILVSALFQMFGPNYFGRDTIRIVGMSTATLGFYLALLSLIQVKWDSEWRAQWLQLKDQFKEKVR